MMMMIAWLTDRVTPDRILHLGCLAAVALILAASVTPSAILGCLALVGAILTVLTAIWIMSMFEDPQ
jgi:hypothetical protein